MKHDLSENFSKKYKNSLSVWNKLGYGMGEAGSQFIWSRISSYLTLYYTDVVGLLPAGISFIMLIARIWDAVNDPMFGAIAENTNSKMGRYRPYILFGAPILAVLNCLTFLNLDLSSTGKILWCAITYIGCGMAYTAVNISVGCLANSMTADNRQRVSLNAFRGIMGGIVSYTLGAEIIDDNWLRCGIRSDGVIYSCISFSTKLGNAIGGAVGILVIGLVGFKANTQMSTATLTKMNAVINFGPAIMFLMAAVLFALNGMTNELGRENEEKLKEKMVE